MSHADTGARAVPRMGVRARLRSGVGTGGTQPAEAGWTHGVTIEPKEKIQNGKTGRGEDPSPDQVQSPEEREETSESDWSEASSEEEDNLIPDRSGASSRASRPGSRGGSGRHNKKPRRAEITLKRQLFRLLLPTPKELTFLVVFLLVSHVVQKVGSAVAPGEEGPDSAKTNWAGPIPTSAQDHWRDVEAWDCGDPHDVQAVYVAPPEATCAEGSSSGPEQDEEEVEVIVAQRSQSRKVQGYECGLVQTNLAFYCGATDHMTFAHWTSNIELPHRVQVDTCREWWRTKKFEDGKDSMVLSEGTTTRKGYCTHGNTYWSTEVECSHGSFRDYQGNELTGMVNWRQSSVTLKKVDLYLRGDEVIDGDSRRTLDCSSTAGACVGDTRTRFWDVPAATTTQICDLHQVRRVTGVIRKSNGTQTFISRGAGLRLELEEELIECGARVHTTNFPDIVVTRDLDHEPFQRVLPTEEHSKLLYVDAQDAFLDGKAKDSFDAYAGRFQAEQCRQDSLRNKWGYGQMASEQRGGTSSEIVKVGPGTFAQPAGEVWNRFTCRRVVARAKDLDQCYATIPVDLNQDDLELYYRAQGVEVPPPDEREQLFVEPYTHIITPQSTERMCIPKVGGIMFRNVQNRWLKASPNIHLTDPPLNLHKDVKASAPLPPYELTDISEAGLYDPEMKKKIHFWTMFPYLQRELQAKMTEQAYINGYARKGHRGLPGAKDMASGITDPSLLEAMTRWADTVGHLRAASITILIIIIAVAVSHLAAICCRAKGGRQHPAIGRWMHYATILWPSLLHLALRKLQARAKDFWEAAQRHANRERYLRLDNLDNQARQPPVVIHGPAVHGRTLPAVPPATPQDQPTVGPADRGNQSLYPDVREAETHPSLDVSFEQAPGESGSNDQPPDYSNLLQTARNRKHEEQQQTTL